MINERRKNSVKLHLHIQIYYEVFVTINIFNIINIGYLIAGMI